MTLTLTSPAFGRGEPIPIGHTCDGADRSPPLGWTDTPNGTRALALIVDDPDAPAGTWVHWVLFDLPPTISSLPEAVAARERLDELGGASQGRNDFRRIGYGGPCPPPGPPHRYFFKLYALDKKLGLEPGATKRDVERAMEGHVLAQGELMGTYVRRAR